MESGTVCSLSERFSAVTVIVSSSFDGAAVSAASTRNDPIIAATPAQARLFFDIPIGILPAKNAINPTSADGVPSRLYSFEDNRFRACSFYAIRASARPPRRYPGSIGPNLFHCQKATGERGATVRAGAFCANLMTRSQEQAT
jgi:hypothetical protein